MDLKVLIQAIDEAQKEKAWKKFNPDLDWDTYDEIVVFFWMLIKQAWQIDYSIAPFDLFKACAYEERHYIKALLQLDRNNDLFSEEAKQEENDERIVERYMYRISHKVYHQSTLAPYWVALFQCANSVRRSAELAK